MLQGSFRKVDVDGFNVFYREAGSKGAPTILCCTAFRARATCSATSYRCSQIAFIS